MGFYKESYPKKDISFYDFCELVDMPVVIHPLQKRVVDAILSNKRVELVRKKKNVLSFYSFELDRLNRKIVHEEMGHTRMAGAHADLVIVDEAAALDNNVMAMLQEIVK